MWSFLTVFTQTVLFWCRFACQRERAGAKSQAAFSTPWDQSVVIRAERALKNMAAEIRGLLLKAGDTQRRDWLIPIHVEVRLLSACKGKKKKPCEVLLKAHWCWSLWVDACRLLWRTIICHLEDFYQFLSPLHLLFFCIWSIYPIVISCTQL